MNDKQYRRIWRILAQSAWGKLHELATIFRDNGYNAEVLDAVDGEEEIVQRLFLSGKDGEHVASIEYRLFDGDVHGGKGLAVGFSCFGPEAELGPRYVPYAYGANAFTTDLDELRDRLDDFAVGEMALLVLDQLKKWQRHAVPA